MPSKGVKEAPKLSQEQMLWGILALLATAVVCFAAGILVNKVQTARQTAAPSTAGQVERLPDAKEPLKRETPREERAKEAGQESKTAEGVQVSPAPVVIPAGKPSDAPPSRPVTQRGANTQFVPAPPPQREEKEKGPAKKAESSPVTEPPAAPSPLADLPAPVEMAAKQAGPAPTPAPSAPVPPSEEKNGLSPSTGFTIQVGSFDTMANAEAFKKAIESKSDYVIELYPVKGSKVVKACVGKFDTKEAATKERAELDRIKDFKGCFVKAIAEL